MTDEEGERVEGVQETNVLKRKGRTQSNTRAIPRLMHTLHDGQRSDSTPRVEEKERGLVEKTNYCFGLLSSKAQFHGELSDDTRWVSDVHRAKGRQTPGQYEQRGRWKLKRSRPLSRSGRIATQRSRWRMQSKETKPSKGLVENAVILLRGVVKCLVESYNQEELRGVCPILQWLVEHQDRWYKESINNVRVLWRIADGKWTVDRPRHKLTPCHHHQCRLRELECRGSESPEQTLRLSVPLQDARVAMRSDRKASTSSLRPLPSRASRSKKRGVE